MPMGWKSIESIMERDKDDIPVWCRAEQVVIWDHVDHTFQRYVKRSDEWTLNRTVYIDAEAGIRDACEWARQWYINDFTTDSKQMEWMQCISCELLQCECEDDEECDHEDCSFCEACGNHYCEDNSIESRQCCEWLHFCEACHAGRDSCDEKIDKTCAHCDDEATTTRAGARLCTSCAMDLAGV